MTQQIAVIVARYSWGQEILRRSNRTDLVIVLNVQDTRGRLWAGLAVPDGPKLGIPAYEAIESLRSRGVPMVKL